MLQNSTRLVLSFFMQHAIFKNYYKMQNANYYKMQNACFGGSFGGVGPAWIPFCIVVLLAAHHILQGRTARPSDCSYKRLHRCTPGIATGINVILQLFSRWMHAETHAHTYACVCVFLKRRIFLQSCLVEPVWRQCLVNYRGKFVQLKLAPATGATPTTAPSLGVLPEASWQQRKPIHSPWVGGTLWTRQTFLSRGKIWLVINQSNWPLATIITHWTIHFDLFTVIGHCQPARYPLSAVISQRGAIVNHSHEWPNQSNCWDIHPSIFLDGC